MSHWNTQGWHRPIPQGCRLQAGLRKLPPVVQLRSWVARVHAKKFPLPGGPPSPSLFPGGVGDSLDRRQPVWDRPPARNRSFWEQTQRKGRGRREGATSLWETASPSGDSAGIYIQLNFNNLKLLLGGTIVINKRNLKFNAFKDSLQPRFDLNKSLNNISPLSSLISTWICSTTTST